MAHFATEWVVHFHPELVVHFPRNTHDSAQWVLEADIAACFDAISHEWLIDNIPVDIPILRRWLKAGFVFKNELFPTVAGTPQGGIISPALANMTLDGLEKTLAMAFPQAPKQRLRKCTWCVTRTTWLSPDTRKSGWKTRSCQY